jgi:hypothetical protein
LRVQRLKEPSDYLRREHVLTGAQRDVRIRERDAGVTLRHELLARRALHGFEHSSVEHVPRANLLRDHLAARELAVKLALHVQPLQRDTTYCARNVG